MKESYAVQAGERAAAALARRREDMVAGRIMGRRHTRRGHSGQGLPAVANVLLCDDFIQAPPGSARRAVREPVCREKLPVRNLQ